MSNEFSDALAMMQEIFKAALEAGDLRGLRITELHIDAVDWRVCVYRDGQPRVTAVLSGSTKGLRK